MALRIAIDASRALSARATGTERYSLKLLSALIEANQARQAPHQFTLYLRDAPPPHIFQPDDFVEKRVIPLPRQPGLGVELNRTALERYKVG